MTIVMVRLGKVAVTVLTVLPMAIAPPKNAAPATPTPPATCNAPVVVEVLAVVPKTFNPPLPVILVVPPISKLPP